MVSKRPIRFPWNNFIRLTLVQGTVLLLIFILGSLANRRVLEGVLLQHATNVNEPAVVSTLRVYDITLVGFFLAALVLMMIFVFWTYRSLMLPLEGIFGNMAAYPRAESLEGSLDAIRKDLEFKTESLAREREELTTLMGAISDGILAVDAEGIPLFYNSRFALLVGAELRSMDGGRLTRPLWDFFPDTEVVNSYQGALRGGVRTSGRTLELDLEGQGKRFFSLSVSPLHKSGGGIYGAVGIFHDVTELKSAEQIRIDFVANVSHELRTPLTSIKGYTDTLIADAEAGREIEKSFLEIIARNVARLMNLISDLLDLSALESTDILQKSEIPLREFTERVVKQLEPAIQGRRQELRVQVRTPWLKADPKRVEQVLINLLENASKYSATGGHLELSWDQDADSVVLRVSDDGPGIPPEHHSRLFERFYRVDKARSRDQGGTGLGLAIVKHILQRHGGAVAVESQVGVGSSFICRFPNSA